LLLIDYILDMPIIQLNGLSSSQIKEKYNVSLERIGQFAREHDLPYISSDGGKTINFYVFDKEAEEAFASRRGRGRPATPKPPKVPKKIGRPRKENKEAPKKNSK